MNNTFIKSFSIFGLFGVKDVHIPFDKNVKILIGENGLGKTQVLNIFYYTLTKNFPKLSEFNFSSLEISFNDNNFIRLDKSDIENLYKISYNNPIIKELIDSIGYSQFEILKEEIASGFITRRRMEDHPLYASLSRIAPIEYIIHTIERSILDSRHSTNAISMKKISKKFQRNPTLENCEEKINQNLEGIQIMYFPTFRRVEEDLRNLGYSDDNVKLNREDNRLIHFGMDDVKKRFNNTENKIDRLLKEGLAQFTKDILNVVIDDADASDNILEKITEDDIDIILSRVGTLLPPNQKEAVRNIVAQKQLKNPLSAYLLQKLIDIYEKQKKIDSSVKIFRDVCNKYLVDKTVFYDESEIKIYIKSNITSEEIALSKLSSGEKQIISIFSKIYLTEENERFIMLFDEPELSLSMPWQQQLLPDIIDSGKCDFLLAVTHSPFIFDNKLDEFAVGLDAYMNISANTNSTVKLS